MYTIERPSAQNFEVVFSVHFSRCFLMKWTTMSKLGLTTGIFVLRAPICMVSSSTSLQLLNTFVYFSNCTDNSCAVITSSSFQYLFLLLYFLYLSVYILTRLYFRHSVVIMEIGLLLLISVFLLSNSQSIMGMATLVR